MREHERMRENERKRGHECKREREREPGPTHSFRRLSGASREAFPGLPGQKRL
jgi:hypothetical protein